MKYGDIELLNSKLFNLKVENLDSDPDFSVDDISRIYYNNIANSYRFNNGTSYVDLSLPNNFSALIETLGTNWVNNDFTFNPTAFNNLNTISGLTSNSTLFNVFQQLDTAIHALDAPNFNDLSDVILPDGIVTGYMMYYNNGEYSFDTLDNLIKNYANVKVSSLKDVATTIVDGGFLMYSQATGQYQQTRPSIILEDFFNTTEHSISHDLGIKYLGVQIIDASNDQTITNAIVQYIDTNSLSIKLTSAAPIRVILTIPYGSQ